MVDLNTSRCSDFFKRFLSEVLVLYFLSSNKWYKKGFYQFLNWNDCLLSGMKTINWWGFCTIYWNLNDVFVVVVVVVVVAVDLSLFQRNIFPWIVSLIYVGDRLSTLCVCVKEQNTSLPLFVPHLLSYFQRCYLFRLMEAADNLVATLTIDQTSIRLEIPHNTTGYYKAPQCYHKAFTDPKQHDLQKMRFHWIWIF